MTLQECYSALGGDFEDVKRRLPTDRMVQKFVLKFLNDPSFQLLCDSLESENYPEAFRAAHTIKGVCQNLSFSQLQESSEKLTEALRDGPTPEVPALFAQVKADYQRAADAIRAFEKELDG